MGMSYYDEVEIEDMAWDEEKGVFHYPCPCGDRFEISRQQLANYEDVATCPSCSLVIRIIFDPLDFEDNESEDGSAAEEDNSTSDDEVKDDEKFQDAMGNLDLNDEPIVVTLPETSVT